MEIIQAPWFKERLPVLAAVVLTSPFSILFVHLYGENRGFLMTCVCIAFYGVIYLRWKVSKKWAFIAVTVPLCLIQLTIIILMPLPDYVPGFVMIPIGIADAILVDVLIGFVEKAFNKN